MKIWPAKDPAEVLDFTWTVPVDDGDTVATAVATKTSGDAAIDDQTLAAPVLRVWLSGGTADALNYLSLTAVTNGGRTFREVGVLPIVDRASELLAAFRLRYPAFDDVDDGKIGFWLADAGLQVGTSWIEAGREPGKLAWAAHSLAASGALSGVIPAGLTMFRSGTFHAQVSDKIAGQQGLNATIYGREFLTLRRASFAGPRLAWTPPASLDVC